MVFKACSHRGWTANGNYHFQLSQSSKIHCYSKYGTWLISMGLICGLIRNAESHAPSQIFWIKIYILTSSLGNLLYIKLHHNTSELNLCCFLEKLFSNIPDGSKVFINPVIAQSSFHPLFYLSVYDACDCLSNRLSTPAETCDHHGIPGTECYI